MSGVGVPGISSQYDQYIERLVELEKVQRKPLEERLDQNKLRQTVWRDLNRRLLRLQETGARLYGLNNVFGDRLTKSSDESIAVMTSRRNVDPIDLQVQVHQVAAADRFFSRPLDHDYTVDEGVYRFLVGEKEVVVNFSGGTIEDFTNELNSVDTEILRASLVRSSTEHQTWFLESRILGADHALVFEDNVKKLAFDLGLITDQVDFSLMVESDSHNVNASGRIFNPHEELLLSSGRIVSLSVDSEDSRIAVGSGIKIDYQVQERSLPNVSFLSPSGRFQSTEQALSEGRLLPAERENVPYDLPVIHSYENIYIRVNNKLVFVSSLPSVLENDGSVQISLDQFAGQRLQGIVFSNQDEIRDISITNIDLSLPNINDWMPANVASRAEDADFTVDGVRVTRDNNFVDDLIPGQSIQLLGASEKIVTLSNQNDVDAIRSAIDDFILTYNWVIAHINVVTAMQKDESVIENTQYFFNVEEIEHAKKILGMLQGDQQMVGLKNRMQTQMTTPHPVGKNGDRLMAFGEMGVSTRRLGGAQTASDRLGYFDIHDKKRFEEALATRLDDVRDFFARDPAMLGVFESGLLAAQDVGIIDITKTYTQSPRGIIAVRTTQIDGEVRRNEKALETFDEEIERKRNQWIRDFAEAENAQREMERIQSQIEGINRSQGR